MFCDIHAISFCIAEKERLLSSIRIMSLIGLGIGVVSVVVGILVFVFLEGGGYPITSAVGIWYGLMVGIKVLLQFKVTVMFQVNEKIFL